MFIENLVGVHIGHGKPTWLGRWGWTGLMGMEVEKEKEK